MKGKECPKITTFTQQRTTLSSFVRHCQNLLRSAKFQTDNNAVKNKQPKWSKGQVLFKGFTTSNSDFFCVFCKKKRFWWDMHGIKEEQEDGLLTKGKSRVFSELRRRENRREQQCEWDELNGMKWNKIEIYL